MTERRKTSGRCAIVIGGGIVGLSAEFFLHCDGWSVTVLDPRPAAETTACGSAGLFAVGHVTPIAMPGLLRQLPRMLLDKESPLELRPAYLPSLAPWLVRFVRAGSGLHVGPICTALQTLLGGAQNTYRVVLAERDAGALVPHSGLLVLYRDVRSWNAATQELDIEKRLGVRFECIDGPAILRLIAGFAPLPRASCRERRALLWPRPYRADDRPRHRKPGRRPGGWPAPGQRPHAVSRERFY
jgi:D-amino-acid dehydrogenase